MQYTLQVCTTRSEFCSMHCMPYAMLNIQFALNITCNKGNMQNACMYTLFVLHYLLYAVYHTFCNAQGNRSKI